MYEFRNSYVYVLTLCTSACEFIWKYDHFRCNQLRWCHTGVGWAPKAIDWWPCKKSKSLGDSDISTEKRILVKTYREETAKYKERGMNKSVLHGPQEEPILLTPSSETSYPQNHKTTHFCCLNHLVCGTLLQQPWSDGKYMHFLIWPSHSPVRRVICHVRAVHIYVCDVKVTRLSWS